jgi:hypothetical protein
MNIVRWNRRVNSNNILKEQSIKIKQVRENLHMWGRPSVMKNKMFTVTNENP